MTPERFRREVRRIVPGATEEAVERLLAFARLLAEFAHPLGLVGERRAKRLLSEHLLDAVFLVPHLTGGPVADLGSGAGLPGMVLAIMRPELEVWLVEPRRRAVSFLEYARATLDLPGVRVVRARAEDTEVPRNYFAAVTARAVADLAELWRLSEPLLRTNGILLAPKGPRGEAEIRELLRRRPDLRIEKHPYRTTGPKTLLLIKVFKGSPS